MKSFKIDYAACKTSPGGNIMAKIENFQSHFKEHERMGHLKKRVYSLLQ